MDGQVIETPDYKLIKRKLSPQSLISETGTRGDKSLRLESGGASPALKPTIFDQLMQARERTTSVLVVKKDAKEGRKMSTPRRRLRRGSQDRKRSLSAMFTPKQKLISDIYTPKRDGYKQALDESIKSTNL